MHRRTWITVTWVLVCATAIPAENAPTELKLNRIDGQGELGYVQIHGVAAATFDPVMWEAGTLHIVPDIRSPLIVPRWAGGFRNIYAPSIVRVPEGWRVFYGAWDGVATGHDRIYTFLTADFLDLGERSMLIDHGDFIHVCNVSAVRTGDGTWHLLCTAYPDDKQLNKPSYFSSPDGKNWNGSPAPHAARKSDLVTMTGYAAYDDADINGVNVLFYDRGQFHMYFCNWRKPGHVHLAHSADGKNYVYDGPVLDTPHAVNDVRKFTAKGRTTYVMGLHRNTDRLWYALSADGRKFGPEKELAVRLGDEDRFIVALGWVTDGDRLPGFLYGAGASHELNRNRIFARWLQKKVVLVDTNGQRHEPTGAIGPDRQVIPLKAAKSFEGTYEVWSEDGRTRLSGPHDIRAKTGDLFQLTSGK